MPEDANNTGVCCAAATQFGTLRRQKAWHLADAALRKRAGWPGPHLTFLNVHADVGVTISSSQGLVGSVFRRAFRAGNRRKK
jgi:hypothetical protein